MQRPNASSSQGSESASHNNTVVAASAHQKHNEAPEGAAPKGSGGGCEGPSAAVGAFGEMVCYGIGHFGVSRASALQAALAVLLHRHLGVQGPMLMYDPVITENEKQAAVALGFTLLPHNEVGLRVAHEVGALRACERACQRVGASPLSSPLGVLISNCTQLPSPIRYAAAGNAGLN
jgi:hypothetical protein